MTSGLLDRTDVGGKEILNEGEERSVMTSRRIPRASTWAVVVAIVVGISLLGARIANAAWRPTRPVEFNVPAGTGGGADIMARFVGPLFQKSNLTDKPFIVVNRSGGAGAEGFLHVKGERGDAHVVTLTLGKLFTTPLSPRAP